MQNAVECSSCDQSLGVSHHKVADTIRTSFSASFVLTRSCSSCMGMQINDCYCSIQIKAIRTHTLWHIFILFFWLMDGDVGGLALPFVSLLVAHYASNQYWSVCLANSAQTYHVPDYVISRGVSRFRSLLGHNPGKIFFIKSTLEAPGVYRDDFFWLNHQGIQFWWPSNFGTN